MKRGLTLTMGNDAVPISSGYLLHVAWGIISPNITMANVEIRKPMSPPEISAIKIDNKAFTATLPKSNVHNRRFPFSLTGAIALASFAWVSSPEPITILKPFMSNDNKPKVSPENRADS